MADFSPQGIYVNGFLYSMASAEIDVDGKKFRALNALNWSSELQREDVQGIGAVPVGSTRGKLVQTADMELIAHEGFLFYNYLSQKAVEVGAAGPGCVAFNVGVSLDEPGSVGTNSVDLLNITMKKVEKAIGQGSAGLVMKFTLHVVQPILINGVPIITETNSALAEIGNVALVAAATVTA